MTTAPSPLFVAAPERRKRDAAEVIGALAVLGAALVVGMSTGVFAAGPVGVLLTTVLCLWLVRRAGEPWANIGLRRASWWRTGLLAVAAWIGVTLVIAGVSFAIQAATGEAADLSALAFVEGNLTDYLVMLAVGWSTAAIGEEIVFRGFILQRLERILGGASVGATTLAIVAQAALFGLAHSYQGLTGSLQTVAVGLAMGGVLMLTRRNLWVCILAHGLIDTVGLTALYLGALTPEAA